MAHVSFRHVYKFYKSEIRPSVKDFDLEVNDGEFLVLVGPSGCGKTTTLRMLAGLEEISEGEIYIGDRFINYVSPKNRDIAMVFQNYALYPNLSVFDNMSLGLKLRKMAKHEIDLRVKRAAATLEIYSLLDKRPNQLSGGQKQRVALGRAIVREPQVFLMDEPLSNLDAKLRTQTRSELIRLHQELRSTTVYVTHDQTEAMTMGSRIVVMKDGEIQQVATPKEIYNHPRNQFVAGFIGSPPMNFLEGAVTEDAGRFYFETKRWKLPIPESVYPDFRRTNASDLRQVVMGIRPEHVACDPEQVRQISLSTMSMKVDIRELMGADMFLYLNAGEARIIARVEAHSSYEPGDLVEAAFRMEKAHFFDKNTGMSLHAREDADA